jgi:hypothetical protein
MEKTIFFRKNHSSQTYTGVIDGLAGIQLSGSLKIDLQDVGLF